MNELDVRASLYGASPIRHRATPTEMLARREAVVRIVSEDAPTSVRHVYYRAVTEGLVPKNDLGYKRVQREVLAARRDGDIPYDSIVDSTRWARRATTYNGVTDALTETARFYRRDLWSRSQWRLEVWAESDSIAGVIHPVTEKWAVPLMVTRGYASESFAWSAAQEWAQDDRSPLVIYVGDHDPDGLAIESTLRRQLGDFYAAATGEEYVVEWERVGVTWEQVQQLDLEHMGTPPKRRSGKHPYRYPVAVEAEALPAPYLREVLDVTIDAYADRRQLGLLLEAERSEREVLARILAAARDDELDDGADR